MIRSDFVSNSSSSSFIFCVNTKQLNELIDIGVIKNIIPVNKCDYFGNFCDLSGSDPIGCKLNILTDGCNFDYVELDANIIQETIKRCTKCNYKSWNDVGIDKCPIHNTLNLMLQKIEEGYRLIKCEINDGWCEPYTDELGLDNVEFIKKYHKDKYILCINNH